MSTEPKRICPSCGNEFSGAMEFCPVCLLRKGLADGVESGESSASEEAVKPTISEQTLQRFEHYQLVNRSDIVIERQTLQGLRTTVNLSQMDAAPLGLQMFLVSGSSGRELQKLGVPAKAR